MNDEVKIEVTLPKLFHVKRGGNECIVELEKIHADVLARIFLEGVKTVVGDAASGAASAAHAEVTADDKAWARLSRDARKTWVTNNGVKVAEHAGSCMAVKRDKTLYGGDWNLRSSDGPAHDDFMKAVYAHEFFDIGEAKLANARRVVRLGKPEKFKGMPDAEFLDHVAAWAEKLPEPVFKALCESAQAQIDAERAALAKRKSVAIKIELPNV